MAGKGKQKTDAIVKKKLKLGQAVEDAFNLFINNFWLVYVFALAVYLPYIPYMNINIKKLNAY